MDTISNTIPTIAITINTILNTIINTISIPIPNTINTIPFLVPFRPVERCAAASECGLQLVEEHVEGLGLAGVGGEEGQVRVQGGLGLVRGQQGPHGPVAVTSQQPGVVPVQVSQLPPQRGVAAGGRLEGHTQEVSVGGQLPSQHVIQHAPGHYGLALIGTHTGRRYEHGLVRHPEATGLLQQLQGSASAPARSDGICEREA
mmetsp:Transcript_16868/g.23229  ORF Transcript_16868/g.23229 Transcript_16868/m.23229 type:complete len:202 (-) Transcript_16868:1172-1777(-)